MTTSPYFIKYALAEAAAKRQAIAISANHHEFNTSAYIKDVLTGIETMELKDRVKHMMACLNKHLPSDFRKAAPILAACANTFPPPGKDDPYPAIFASWPLIDYVGQYGLEHPELALETLKTITPLFTAEFAIQPFLLKHFDLTHKTMLGWCDDSSDKVRRLASEGMRPRLPWGLKIQRLCKDPSPLFPILNKLKSDSSLYVRKSVANNINDISKDNPDIAIKLCRDWLTECRGDQGEAAKNTDFIIRVGTRTLIKDGNPEVLELLGFPASNDVLCKNLTIQGTSIQKKTKLPVINVGEDITFECELYNKSKTKKQNIIVDFAVHFVRLNDKSSRKVFKLSNKELSPLSSVTVKKKVSFKPVNARKFYPGVHEIEVLVNGKSVGTSQFFLQ